MLFVLLARSDIATRPRIVHSNASKRRMGIRDNFTRLAVFDKKNGQSGNKRFTGQQKKKPGECGIEWPGSARAIVFGKLVFSLL